jgi:hypothetical protein
MVLSLGVQKGNYLIVYMRDNNNKPLLDRGILLIKFHRIYPYFATLNFFGNNFGVMRYNAKKLDTRVKEVASKEIQILEKKLGEIESDYEKPENLILPVSQNQKIVGYETDGKGRAIYLAIRAIIGANKIFPDNVELLLKAPGLKFFRYENLSAEQRIRVDKMLK